VYLFTGLKREWIIRRVLNKLSRQRVVGILQPGNVWIIEKGVITNEETGAALRTRFMRGWIDVMENNVRHGSPLPDGTISKPWFQSVGPTWKLTDSGWAAIQRTHEWELIGILIAALSAFLALK
jgi:hypothetical protein